MGATAWHYFTPYQADVAAALQELRRQVFERGAYFKPWEETVPFFLRDLRDRRPEDLSDVERQVRQDLLQALGDFPRLTPPDPLPATIEEVLEYNAEMGTHSILDIEGVAGESAFGAATPVPEARLLRLFGTARPTRDQVEAREFAFADDLERWQAVYLVTYKGGVPDAIYFEGVSGD
jgi:hypothetical protein